jgi:hypothetical protein
MAKRMQRLMVAVAAMASLALGGAVFAQAQSTHGKALHAATAAHHATVGRSAGAVDGENVQSGNQSTPDQPGVAAGNESSGAVNPEQSGNAADSATNSDGLGGHADAPGANVDHQFQGNE